MNEFVEDLHARIVQGLTQKLGVSAQTAGLVAAEVVGGLCDTWQGCEPYIGRFRSNAARDRAIIRDFKNGERPAFLARRYNLTRQRIKQIIDG